MTGEAVEVVQHHHPDHTVGGVEHHTLLHPQDVGGAENVKLRQAQVSVRHGGHHRLHVIVAGAGQRLTMKGALRLEHLHALLEGVAAHVQHQIEVLVGGFGHSATRDGEMGLQHRQRNLGGGIAPIFGDDVIAADTTNTGADVLGVAGKGEVLGGLHLLGLPHLHRQVQVSRRLDQRVDKAGVNAGVFKIELLRSARRHGEGVGADVFLGTGRNGRRCGVPDIFDRHSIRKRVYRACAVVTIGGGVGVILTAQPSGVGGDLLGGAVGKLHHAVQHKAAVTLGKFIDTHRHHLHPRVEIQRISIGIDLGGEGKMRGPRLFVINEEVAAHVGRAGSHKLTIAIEAELRITAVGKGNLANFLCKGILLYKLANRIITGFLVAEAVINGGLCIGIADGVQPNPILFHSVISSLKRPYFSQIDPQNRDR